MTRTTKPTTAEERAEWRHNMAAFPDVRCSPHVVFCLLDDLAERDEVLLRARAQLERRCQHDHWTFAKGGKCCLDMECATPCGDCVIAAEARALLEPASEGDER